MWYRDWLSRLERTARAHGLSYDPLLFSDSESIGESLLRHSASIIKWYRELSDGRKTELRKLMGELELIRMVAERLERGDC